jgi:hypothetical protein
VNSLFNQGHDLCSASHWKAASCPLRFKIDYLFGKLQATLPPQARVGLAADRIAFGIPFSFLPTTCFWKFWDDGI